jgi:hypothetical protein
MLKKLLKLIFVLYISVVLLLTTFNFFIDNILTSNLAKLEFAAKNISADLEKSNKIIFTLMLGMVENDDIYPLLVEQLSDNELPAYVEIAESVRSLKTNAGDYATTKSKTVDIFPEGCYLLSNPDVSKAVEKGDFASGYQHFEKFGKKEGREKCSQ